MSRYPSIPAACTKVSTRKERGNTRHCQIMLGFLTFDNVLAYPQMWSKVLLEEQPTDK